MSQKAIAKDHPHFPKWRFPRRAELKKVSLFQRKGKKKGKKKREKEIVKNNVKSSVGTIRASLKRGGNMIGGRSAGIVKL